MKKSNCSILDLTLNQKIEICFSYTGSPCTGLAKFCDYERKKTSKSVMPMDSQVKFYHPQNISGASEQNSVAVSF